MGKTKTMFVEGVTDEKKTGKEVYEEKMRKKAAAAKAEVEKAKVGKLGLKGGERIKVVGAELPTEVPQEAVTEGEEQKETQVESKGKAKKIRIRSKNYKGAKSKIDKNKNYPLAEAIKILKEISYSKFDPTVELHLVIRTKGFTFNLNLPHSGGKQKRVEFANEETIEKLKKGKIDFDMLLATADMMPKLVPFARTLGPRGLMPNPKNGTLVKSKKEMEKFSGNTLTLKTEKDAPVMHTVVGKLSQKDSELMENTQAIFNGVGTKQIVKAYIKSTMSPSIKLQI